MHGERSLKLYNFKEWSAKGRAVQLTDWDTDEVIFKKEFAKIKSDWVVVDVGSEYGFYAIMAGKLVGSEGKVLAIEAHPETYRLLEMNIRLHGLVDRVIPICRAVGKDTGKVKLYETFSPGSTSIVPRRSIFQLNKDRLRFWLYFLKNRDFLRVIRKRFTPVKYVVPLDKLDNIVDEYGLRRINLIKVDVEGAELDVLKGSFSVLKKYKPILLIEVHYGVEWKPKVLYRLLKNFGYNLTIEEGRTFKALVVAYPKRVEGAQNTE